MPPRARPSRSADAPVTSAVNGPDADPDAVPDLDDRDDLARDEVQRRIVGIRAADRDVPRVDDDPDLAVARVGRVEQLAASELHLRQAVLLADRAAVEQVRAGERRDERVGGAETSSSGEPICRSSPSTSTPTGPRQRDRVLVVVGHEQRRQLEVARAAPAARLARSPSCARRARRAARRGAARRGSRASARASATRCRSPPESSAGPGVARGARSGSARAARRRAPCRRRRRSPHAQVREERVVLEDEPDAPLVGRQVDAALDVEPALVAERDRARRGPSRPGDRRSTVVLPGARRPDERDRALDLELELELEGANAGARVDREGCHARMSFRVDEQERR